MALVGSSIGNTKSKQVSDIPSKQVNTTGAASTLMYVVPRGKIFKGYLTASVNVTYRVENKDGSGSVIYATTEYGAGVEHLFLEGSKISSEGTAGTYSIFGYEYDVI